MAGKGILASLLVKLGLDSKGFESGIDKAKKKTDVFSSGLKKIGGMIAGAFAAGAVLAFGKELVKLGGIAEGVRAAFNRIADEKVLTGLKEATRGTVSELELMKRAVSANNLGIPIENLASLFEFATKRAQDTGESVDYLVNSIVLGIGRKSPLILDNLGISAIQLKSKLKGVGTETASVSDIAKAVGEIAADSMEKSGDVIETNAIKVQQLAANWDDLKLSIAEDENFKNLAKNGIGALDAALQGLSNTIEAFKTKGVTLIDMIGGTNAESVAKIVARKIEEQNKARLASINHIDEESAAYRNQIAAEQEAIETKKRHGKTIAEIEAETANLKETLKGYGVNQQTEIQNTLRQIEANEELLKSLTTLRKERENISMSPMATRGKENVSVLGEQTTPGLELGRLNEQIEANTEKAKGLYDKYFRAWDDFKMAMAAATVEFGVEVVDELGMAFGELAKTGEFPKDFGKNILSIIGGFISQLGKMLIGLGIASEAFQSLLKSAFTNPASAGLLIAAGAGLVLLGGAIKGFAKSGPSGSSSSGGGVSSPSYSNAGGYGGDSRRGESKVVFEIQGTTLKGVLNNVDRKYSLIR